MGAVIQREIAGLALTDVTDPRAQGATLTEVSVSPDLKQARVFVTHHAGEEAARAAVAALNHAVPRLRHALAQRVQLRVVPALVFTYDPSADRGFRIEALLREARRDRGPK